MCRVDFCNFPLAFDSQELCQQTLEKLWPSVRLWHVVVWLLHTSYLFTFTINND